MTYTTAHGNAGSLTHWVRPGIEPTSSWILVRFISSVPQQEHHYPFFKILFMAHWLFILQAQFERQLPVKFGKPLEALKTSSPHQPSIYTYYSGKGFIMLLYFIWLSSSGLGLSGFKYLVSSKLVSSSSLLCLVLVDPLIHAKPLEGEIMLLKGNIRVPE